MFVFLIHFIQAWWAGTCHSGDINDAGAYLLLVIVLRNVESNDGSHATVTQCKLLFGWMPMQSGILSTEFELYYRLS